MRGRWRTSARPDLLTAARGGASARRASPGAAGVPAGEAEPCPAGAAGSSTSDQQRHRQRSQRHSGTLSAAVNRHVDAQEDHRAASPAATPAISRGARAPSITASGSWVSMPGSVLTGYG